MGQRLTIKKQKEMKPIFLKILKESHGIITTAQKKAGVTRHYYNLWMEDEDFSKEVEDCERHNLDFVENKLFDLIEQGDKTAIIFYLKCKGKSRNYIETQHIKQENSYTEPLKLIIKVPEPKQIESGEQKKIT